MSIAYRGVEAPVVEILGVARHVDAQRDTRLALAELTEPRREPARAKGGQRRQREARLVDVDRAHEARAQRRKAFIASRAITAPDCVSSTRCACRRNSGIPSCN